MRWTFLTISTIDVILLLCTDNSIEREQLNAVDSASYTRARLSNATYPTFAATATVDPASLIM